MAADRSDSGRGMRCRASRLRLFHFLLPGRLLFRHCRRDRLVSLGLVRIGRPHRRPDCPSSGIRPAPAKNTTPTKIRLLTYFHTCSCTERKSTRGTPVSLASLGSSPLSHLLRSAHKFAREIGFIRVDRLRINNPELRIFVEHNLKLIGLQGQRNGRTWLPRVFRIYDTA